MEEGDGAPHFVAEYQLNTRNYLFVYLCLPVRITSDKIFDTSDNCFFNYFATIVHPEARVLVYSAAVHTQ